MADPRGDVERALEQAVQIAGPSILQEPQRLEAILADLVGRPNSDHRDEIRAIATTTEVVANGGPRDEQSVVAALSRQRVPGADARWATSVLIRHGVPIQSGPTDTETAPLWRRPWAVASMVVALVAVPVIFLMLPGPSPDDDTTTTTTTTTSTTTTTTTTTEPSPEIVGYDVTFDEAVEGVLRAERTWVIQDDQVAGTIVLTPTSDSGITQHRELVPALAFTDPVFTPEPTSTNGDIASFSIDQSAGEVSIRFQATLTTADPDQAAVKSWLANWRERVPALRPVDDEEPARATVTPRREPAG